MPIGKNIAPAIKKPYRCSLKQVYKCWPQPASENKPKAVPMRPATLSIDPPYSDMRLTNPSSDHTRLVTFAAIAGVTRGATFSGATVWEGAVHVFHLTEHPAATKLTLGRPLLKEQKMSFLRRVAYRCDQVAVGRCLGACRGRASKQIGIKSSGTLPQLNAPCVLSGNARF